MAKLSSFSEVRHVYGLSLAGRYLVRATVCQYSYITMKRRRAFYCFETLEVEMRFCDGKVSTVGYGFVG